MKHKILVVDDEPDAVELVAFNVKAAGYDVITAGNGEEALTKARSAAPDLIVLDLMLPNLDGFAFMTQNESHLKRIIVTSAASPSLIRERLRGTPFDMLPKPFDITDLVGRVRACIVSQTPS